MCTVLLQLARGLRGCCLHIQVHELAALVQELLAGDITRPQFSYIHAMLDSDGDGRISSQEFLHAAKDCLQAEAAHRSGRDNGEDDMRYIIEKAGSYFQGNIVSTHSHRMHFFCFLLVVLLFTVFGLIQAWPE